MSTVKESICCKEIENIMLLLNGEEETAEARPQCIIQHAGFRDICLSIHILTVALYSHHHRYGTSDIPTDENR